MPGSRLAWWIAAVSALLALVDTALVLAAYDLLSRESVGIHGWPLVNIAALGSAVIGAVILGSRPHHPIGWLLNLIGLTTSISLATESYGTWVLKYDGPGTAAQGHLGSWTAALLGGPLALACLTVAFLLVPAGSYLSPRWRWVARTALAGYVIFAIGVFLVGPNGMNRNGDPIDAGPGAEVLLNAGIVLIALMVLASVVSLALRLRRSSGAVRQQVRVVAVGAASVGFALAAVILAPSSEDGRQAWWSNLPLYMAYAFLVVCLALAVLRYRLYDVEVIISRALVLAIATGLVAAGYVGLVVIFGGMVGDRADGGFWLSLLATVIVAVAFQPARRSVVRVADRLAYGDRAAPYEALADFSRRIGRSPATSDLLATIAAAAGEAVSADAVIVSVEAEAGAQLTASWPPAVAVASTPAFDPAGADVVVPIRDESGVLGSISLSLPPGRDARPVEQRLVSDIAEQAALALRNDRLQIELAAKVRQLDQQTRQLTDSRNRIIGVADAERQRLEAEIGRGVIPTMRRLREDVDQVVGTAQAQRIGDCVALAMEALESLRELTRGIYPTMLTRSGLGPALISHAARLQRAEALRIDPDVGQARFPARVEAAAYFCCVEVLGQPTGEIGLDLDDRGELVLSMAGVSLDALNRGAILDRVEAAEGSLDVGSSLRIRFPAAAPQTRPAAAELD